jgi:hypothetical protein
MLGLPAMAIRAAAAACAKLSGERKVEAGSAAAYPAINEGEDGAQRPASRQRLLRSFYNPKTAKRALSRALKAQPEGGSPESWRRSRS